MVEIVILGLIVAWGVWAMWGIFPGREKGPNDPWAMRPPETAPFEKSGYNEYAEEMDNFGR